MTEANQEEAKDEGWKWNGVKVPQRRKWEPEIKFDAQREKLRIYGTQRAQKTNIASNVKNTTDTYKILRSLRENFARPADGGFSVRRFEFDTLGPMGSHETRFLMSLNLVISLKELWEITRHRKADWIFVICVIYMCSCIIRCRTIWDELEPSLVQLENSFWTWTSLEYNRFLIGDMSGNLELASL